MATQTSFTAEPTKGLPGQLATCSWNELDSCRVDASAPVPPGVLVMRTANGDRAADVPPAVAADADAIKTNIGSTAGTQNFTTSDFNGAIGAGRISPPAKIDLVLSSHADWDATSATLSGIDENGLPVSETLSIPNGGNATVTSSNYYSRVTALSIPAQSGTGGTATLGTSASVTLDGSDVLGMSVHTHKALLDPSGTDNENYEDEDDMPVLRAGLMYADVENTYYAGEVALVRVVAGAAEQRGALRARDTDGGDCVPCRRIIFRSSGTSTERALVEIVAAARQR